eukprot:GFUD01031097.1.p1 GENE.GFUD01031097.1~~GFUD01031097.1.p1  ORF type:complete len:544 (+),score=197.82 GFUD01031097.1:43-1632(+)
MAQTGTNTLLESIDKRKVVEEVNSLIQTKEAKIEVIEETGLNTEDTAVLNRNIIVRLNKDNVQEIRKSIQQEVLTSHSPMDNINGKTSEKNAKQVENVNKREDAPSVEVFETLKKENSVEDEKTPKKSDINLDKINPQDMKQIQPNQLTDNNSPDVKNEGQFVAVRIVDLQEKKTNDNSVEEKLSNTEGSLLTTNNTVSEMQRGKSGTANNAEILQNLKEADRKVDELEVKSKEKTIAVQKAISIEKPKENANVQLSLKTAPMKQDAVITGGETKTLVRETGKDNTNGGSSNKDFWKIALGVGLLSSLGFFYSSNAEPEAKTPAREDELKEDNTEYEKCTIADTILHNEDDKDDIVNKQLENINAESKVEKQPEELKDHNENDLESCMDTPNRVCDKILENSTEIMDGNNSIETNANIEETVTEAMDTTIVNTNNIARLTEDNLNEIKKYDQKEEKAIEENIKEKLCGNEPNDTNPSHIENLETSEKDVATFMKIAESMLEQDRDISTEEDKFDQTEEQQEAGGQKATN